MKYSNLRVDLLIYRLITSALFVMALYAPTSIGGTYSEPLWLLYLALLSLVFLGLVFFRTDGLANVWLCVAAMSMIAVILIATIVSPFPDYRWGGLLGYLLLGLLFTVNWGNLSSGVMPRTLWVYANCINVIAGIAIIVGISPVQAFVIQHYSQFYPELVPFMMQVHKPVLSFGTHSLAAFIFYLLFWANFETYKTQKRFTEFFFALCNIGLGFALLSFSGLVLMSLAVLQILIYMFEKRRRVTLVVLTAILIAILSAGFYFSKDVEESLESATAIGSILSSPTNGLLGRFSDLGTLHSTMSYLLDKPFSPVGIGYRSDLFFGDSGIVEYYLRGSLPLVLAIYGGLFAFLRMNMVSKRDAWHLFIIILLFEMGFTSLTDFHVLYFLPVLVVYFNDLRRSIVSVHSQAVDFSPLAPNNLLPRLC